MYEWLSKHWKDILVVFCFISLVGFVMKMQQCSSDGLYEKLTQDYKEQADAFKAEIKALEKVNKDWQEQQEELNKEHKQKLEKIQKEYQKDLENIAKKQQKKQKQIVREAERDPNTLTKRVEDVFGIPVL